MRMYSHPAATMTRLYRLESPVKLSSFVSATLVSSVIISSALVASAGRLTAADEDYRAGAVTNQRPMLGVEMSPVPTNIQDREGLDAHQGVLVQSTYSNTAADGMGLQRDDVILGINGQPISSMTDLRNEVGLTAVGDPIEVQITRNGQVMSMAADVKPWPETIPYEKLDSAAEKRFRDWQDRRQQRLADDVARLDKEVDKMRRRLTGEDEPGAAATKRGHEGLEIAFRFQYVIEAAKAPTVAAPDLVADEVTPLNLPTDLPTDAPWRITARIGSTTL